MRYDLYIDGKLCDLDDSSLIVLTYTMEQLTNPTAVKNTYSHEVELPSTERNDILFSHYYRNDYLVSIGNFSPIKRVPFTIYNELGEIAESGYIKLDEVHVDKMAHTYKVVLYGGLGSFFYMLGYTDNGDVLKLSDLQYSQNDARLNLRIQRATIDSNGAWGRLSGGNNKDEFDIVNFAPTYQGFVEGDFANDKALFIGRAKGYTSETLQRPIYGINSVDGSNTMYKRYEEGVDTLYRSTIVDLGTDHTEWEMKDLRTYLQRPVLSVRKFVEAVQRRATEYGYTLNLDSAFFNANNPYYNDAWLTLPSLQSLTENSDKAEIQISGNIVVDESEIQEIPLTITMPLEKDGFKFGASLSNIKVTLSKLSVFLNDLVGDGVFHAYNYYLGSGGESNAWFIQIYGEKNGRVVLWSDAKVLTNHPDTAENIANYCEYLAVGGGQAQYEKIDAHFHLEAFSHFATFNKNIDFAITNSDTPDTWVLRIEKYNINDLENTTRAKQLYGTDRVPYIDGYKTISGWVNFTTGKGTMLYGSADISANSTIRSGCIVNKPDLLNMGKSPLELLLSYCKLFGLIWYYESNSNTVTLQQRTTFYNEGTVVDWSARIDYSKDLKIKPFEFDKRFYDFELETQGEWAEQYADKYGRPYGAQRVNTGYDFDKEAKNLLEGNALKGGVEVLEQGKYYNNITQGTYTLGSTTYDKICPSVFLDGGKYALYDQNGNPTEYDVITPTNEANIEYMNALQGYDAQPKVQLHKDNKLESEGGMLLLYTGSIDVDNSPYKNFRLTDDIAEMGLLNDGQLCWVLEGSSVGSLSGETIPKFVRTGYNLSLDMGVPLELDNPDADTEAVQNSIYSQYWRDYLGDRYDTNSRVCECYVYLRGLQVGNALFRNFYYFDNAVWVLNKIANYSMTTEGSTLCEFVKVQDVKNYKGE